MELLACAFWGSEQRPCCISVSPPPLSLLGCLNLAFLLCAKDNMVPA